jgi:type IV secretory pathway VirB2 component (pilin)
VDRFAALRRQQSRNIQRSDPSGPPGDIMIVLGIILLVLGWLLGIHLLWTLGIILIVVGVILELLGAIGRPVFGRRHYY